MRNTIKILILIFALTLLNSGVYAQQATIERADSWEADFTTALQKRKVENFGLGYSTSDDIFLSQEINKALDRKGPPCQVMKIAIDLKYSELEVIKNIFQHGSDLDLDQLCMCANEKKIGKDIMALAIKDSNTQYEVDELTQAQCIEVYGYGTEQAFPDIITPPRPTPPVSASNPGGGTAALTNLP